MKKLVKKVFKTDSIILLILILVSLGSVYYLLLPGFYEPQDLHHIADIYQMCRAISSGQLPPRWGPDFLYGFGYPLFNFYYVGPFYLGAFFYFLSGSLRFSFELVFIVSVLIGSVGFYFFLKQHFSRIASLSAAILFTYTPYKAVQIYVRGAMGELLSLSLMPWLMYFIEKYINEKKRKWFIFSILISSCIILSHNYFWVLIFGFCGLYLAFTAIVKKRIEILWNFILEILFSLGITAYWWLPALMEQKLLNTVTPFPLIDHFPFIKQLIIPSWGYGASLWGANDGMSFQLGIMNILVVMASFFVFLSVKKKKISLIFIWSFIAFVLCIFFMNIRSYFIWKIIPFYNLFQFPWRLLSFTAFFSSILAAFVVDSFPENKQLIPERHEFSRLSGSKSLFTASRYLWAKGHEFSRSLNKKIIFGRASVFLIIALSILLTHGYFKPSRIFYKSDNDYLARMFANRTAKGNKEDVSSDYINYSEDYLLLPKWMDKKPNFLPKEKFNSDTKAVVVKSIREVTPVSWEAEVTVSSPGKLNFYSLYFPGWSVYVNGKKADISIGESGQIVIDLNKGDNFVKVQWIETNLRKTADAISVFFVILLIVFGIKKYDDHHRIAAKNQK